MSSKKKTLEEKQALQAVLICDSFNNNFSPITRHTPQVLIPLINTPILEFSLNALKTAAVEDVFLICCSHSQRIREFVKQWTSKLENDSMNVQVFSSESYTSLGDCLRDLDAKALIRHEFILMFGDCVSNLPLKTYLEEHRSLTKSDKGAVMTLLFKNASHYRRVKSLDDEVFLVVNGATNKVLHYEKVVKSQKKLDVDARLFQENRNVKVHFNLLDSHVAICSVNVLSLFSDNFDFETKDHFVKGILENEEILGHSIYLRICESNTYSSRVVNRRTYDLISKDILQRWSFPISPELENKFCFQRHNIYKFSNVRLTMDSVVEKNVVIGEGTVIGSNAYIVNAVIGSNCKIGNNVKIESAYLWNNVIVEDDCCLSSSIIADNVCIKEKSTIKWSSIAQKVVIGPNVKLEEKLIDCKPTDDDDVIDVNVVGTKGNGYLCIPEEDVDEWVNKDVDDDISWTSSVSAMDTIDEEDFDESNMFFNEVLDSFHRGFDEMIAPENLILEINSSKHAYNIPIKELGILVTKATLELPRVLTDVNSSQQSYSTLLESVLKRFTPVLKNYTKSSESQENFLMAAEEYALCNSENVTPVVLCKIMKHLYDEDVIEEEAIVKWFRNPKPLPALLTESEFTLDNQYSLRNQKSIQAFIKWLEEAEEESSEESD